MNTTRTRSIDEAYASRNTARAEGGSASTRLRSDLPKLSVTWASITANRAAMLGIGEGTQVIAIIKATHVMIGVE